MKTHWYGSKKDIEANFKLSVSLKTPYKLEVEVDRFVEILQGAAWKFTLKPKKTPASGVQTYPPEIKEMIKEKRKVRKKWQWQHKAYLNSLCNSLKKTIKDFKNRGIQIYLESLTADKDSNYLLWKAILKNLKFKPPQLRKVTTNGLEITKRK